jgi:hypothetical protein
LKFYSVRSPPAGRWGKEAGINGTTTPTTNNTRLQMKLMREPLLEGKKRREGSVGRVTEYQQHHSTINIKQAKM